MKTTLTTLRPVVMPGGFIIPLAIALGTFLITRHRARAKMAAAAIALLKTFFTSVTRRHRGGTP